MICAVTFSSNHSCMCTKNCAFFAQAAAANERADALEQHNKALQYKIDALEALANDRQNQCVTLEQAVARAASEKTDAEARARKLGQELVNWQRQGAEES